ncbi:MAG: hypothetical protein H7A09_08145 [Oceanospirillaceae bacterium]|nr:hypothetical protein [Oceanospirillaceae bacterium]MCP5335412.1 hypothetical protein [Oceanospirillaceae bacterium]MCP5351417.1 hypothetical protein [Oceanospirillaceae bacterium]
MDFQLFCEELNIFLTDRFKYKRNYAYVTPQKNIAATTKRFQLYIRLTPCKYFWPQNTITIARIGFYETRKGHCTELLKFILKIAPDYMHIGIENTTDNSALFAEKLGFSIYKDAHYIIKTDILKNRLFIK